LVHFDGFKRQRQRQRQIKNETPWEGTCHNTESLWLKTKASLPLISRANWKAWGYDVPIIVSSAEEAVSAAARLRPDLVLMDIQLEADLDGIYAAERISNELSIPVVYLTAYSDERTLQRAKVARPFGYLLKPFEERELYTTVEIAIYKHQAKIERRRLEEELRQSQKMEAIDQLHVKEAPRIRLPGSHRKNETLAHVPCVPLVPGMLSEQRQAAT
jgi:AmiR/NasT family two-component response regulator